ncbi:hypothetical protein E6H34_05080 [Candidatus Bathyarchaeota archaeon]|nr:MAG: hypothetical protein E6H34_05080 [Candidatus Bathyarchaeota archaeon]
MKKMFYSRALTVSRFVGDIDNFLLEVIPSIGPIFAAKPATRAPPMVPRAIKISGGIPADSSIVVASPKSSTGTFSSFSSSF